MKSLLAVIFVALVVLCLGHDHGHHHHHGDGAEHFHEDEHLEDHRHWYTKEANEKLKEALKDVEKEEWELKNRGTENEPHVEGNRRGKEATFDDSEGTLSDVADDMHSHEESKHENEENHHHSHGSHSHQGDGHHGHGRQGHSHQGHDHEGHGHGGHGHGHHGHSHHGHGHHGHGHHGHGHHGHSHHGHGHHGHGHSHDEDSHDTKGHHGDSHGAHKASENAKATEKSSATPPVQPTRYIWVESILSTCLISAAPFFILFFVPLESNSKEQRPLLKVLLSFASGGLLGDAFLHLIPHAVSPHSHNPEGSHSHSHSHSHVHESESPEHAHDHSADMIVGLWVLAGMLAFLIVEKFVRHVKGGHSHSHGHAHTSSDDDAKVLKSDRQKDDKGSDVKERKKEGNGKAEVITKPEVDDDSTDTEGIKVSGYLNLAADFTHNFTDGLAIGASYLVSRNVGLVTTLTILLHEVPHEIGDFAILVQSGCSKRKAMWLQLSTATGALAGTLCGLLAENIGNAASSGILPFTAGGFIYIATVSVIPELLEDANPKQSVKEVVALLVGVLLMVFIALLE